MIPSMQATVHFTALLSYSVTWRKGIGDDIPRKKLVTEAMGMRTNRQGNNIIAVVSFFVWTTILQCLYSSKRYFLKLRTAMGEKPIASIWVCPADNLEHQSIQCCLMMTNAIALIKFKKLPKYITGSWVLCIRENGACLVCECSVVLGWMLDITWPSPW